VVFIASSRQTVKILAEATLLAAVNIRSLCINRASFSAVIALYKIFQMHVALCLLLVFAITCQADQNSPFDQALNFHCGSSDCTVDITDKIFTTIELRLEGSGFHRRLHYSLELTCLDHNPCRQPLNLAIIQPLPAAIYANIYELDSAALDRKGPEVRLFGEVDVESIEKFAKPTALAIYGSTTGATEVEVKEGGSCVLITISVPLHGRYPRAVQDTNKGERLSWKELFKGLLVNIKLPPPIVLVQSLAPEKLWSRVTVAEQTTDQLQGSNNITWSLPAGDMRLQSITAVITAAVVCMAAAAVLHSILFFDTFRSCQKTKKHL
jgi:PIG-X / PBN1